MAKFIKVKSNAYREILLNKEHILLFRESQNGTVIKLNAPLMVTPLLFIQKRIMNPSKKEY